MTMIRGLDDELQRVTFDPPSDDAEYAPDDVAAILADPHARYSVAQYPGIAFWADRAETRPDEDTEWTGYEQPTGRVLMVMVGDDRRIPTDPEDVTLIPEDAYCPDCGQLGCGWGRA